MIHHGGIFVPPADAKFVGTCESGLIVADDAECQQLCDNCVTCAKFFTNTPEGGAITCWMTSETTTTLHPVDFAEMDNKVSQNGLATELKNLNFLQA